MSILEDGAYVKTPIPAETNVSNYPPESNDNAFSICYGDLLIWSIGHGKMRVEVDDQEKDIIGFTICRQRAEIRKFWEEISICNNDTNSEKYLSGGLVRRSLLVQKPLAGEYRTDYRIVGLLNYIARKDPHVKGKPGGSVLYEHNGSVLFYENSRKKLGVFMSYSTKPQLWDKGSLFVFDIS